MHVGDFKLKNDPNYRHIFIYISSVFIFFSDNKISGWAHWSAEWGLVNCLSPPPGWRGDGDDDDDDDDDGGHHADDDDEHHDDDWQPREVTKFTNIFQPILN